MTGLVLGLVVHSAGDVSAAIGVVSPELVPKPDRDFHGKVEKRWIQEAGSGKGSRRQAPCHLLEPLAACIGVILLTACLGSVSEEGCLLRKLRILLWREIEVEIFVCTRVSLRIVMG